MKTQFLILLSSLVLASSPATAANHPRLFFGPEDVPALREKVKSPPFSDMLARMKTIADQDSDITGKPADPVLHGNMAALRNAFLYTFTGEDQFAAAARRYVEATIDAPDWANPKTKGLRLYNTGAYIAMAYDLCRGSKPWDEAFSERVAQALREQHEVIFTHGGAEQNKNPASNWMGLRWSSAALIQLAIDADLPSERLTTAHQHVERFLTESMGGSPKTRGWGIEGLGYTYYPMANGVTQYILASKRLTPERDLTNHPAFKTALWTIYAALVPSDRGLLRPDFGDDNPGARGEGSYGLAFATCSPELLPGLKYWYDRTVGSLGNKTYDDARFGIAASILYYPSEIGAVNPLTLPAWREAFADTDGIGMQTFRNQYKDENDLVFQIYAKLRGDKGHNGPDALSFRIAGLNTLWATGGGRYQNWGAIKSGVEEKGSGKNIYRRSMNTLYPVDPDDTLRLNSNSGRLLGEPVIHEDGSGWTIMEIDENNVGTKNHIRRFITDFRNDGVSACIIADTSDDGRFWQFVTLGDNKITTRDNTFTATSPAGDTLQGTVLYPPNPIFKTGLRNRGSDALDQKQNAFLHFQSEDGNYLVVLTSARRGQLHPPPRMQGDWQNGRDATVEVGNSAYKITDQTIERRK